MHASTNTVVTSYMEETMACSMGQRSVQGKVNWAEGQASIAAAKGVYYEAKLGIALRT